MPPTVSPLIIVCDWIPPAFGAVGQYALAQAREAASQGRDVTLIGLGAQSEDTREPTATGALRIIRITAGAPDKGSLLKRATWALGINRKLIAATAAAAKAYRSCAERCEVKVTGSPPFLSYLILLWRLGKPHISVTYRITDFYPETAFAAGKALALRPIAPLIHLLRRTADRLEALSPCQSVRLQESGVAAARIALVRDASPVSITPQTRPAPRPFGSDAAIILYSGNLGVAHDWQTFADAYKRHIQSGSNTARLWLNATGVGAPALKEFCETHGLPVHVSAPAPLEQLPSILVAPDAHLVTLKEPFWGYVIPSKIYGCIDSGRPVLYVGPTQSDIHALVGADPRSFSIRNGDVDGCYRALEALKPSRSGETDWSAQSSLLTIEDTQA